jgi:hypothetical protein
LKRQDNSGYSLLHALTSYNHLDLLRTVVREFNVSPNLQDEDDETAVFVAETVEAAQVLVEELGADPTLKNKEGQTAEEKIREEGDFVVVSDYLRETRLRTNGGTVEDTHDSNAATTHPPPLPDGVKVNVGTMSEADVPAEVDEDLRRRIQELAQSEHFQEQEGQEELRRLIQDAVRDVGSQDSNSRRRVE